MRRNNNWKHPEGSRITKKRFCCRTFGNSGSEL